MIARSTSPSRSRTPEGLSLTSRGFQPPDGPAAFPQPRRGWPMRMRGADAFFQHPIENRPGIGQPLRGWGYFGAIYRGLHPRLFMANRFAVNHPTCYLEQAAPCLPAAFRFFAATPQGLSLTSRGFQPPDLAATPLNPGGVGQCAVSPHLSTNAHPTPR